MTERRRRNGDDEIPGRVHGAWTTPSVVVRRPDGTVVRRGEAPADEHSGDEHSADEPTAPADPTPAGTTQPARPRSRPRPRRIPGAPGAVLLTATLTETGVGAERRRLRRNSGVPGSVSPLPPRPPVSATADPGAAPDAPNEKASPEASSSQATGATSTSSAVGGVAAGDEQRGGLPQRPARPPLAVVGDALERSGVRQAVRGLDLGRLLPEDPEARAERIARLQRTALRAAIVAAVVGVVYTVFPVRTAIDLWNAEDRARERQEAFEREIEILEDEVADLKTDERIEVEARQENMVLPGEESYGIFPAPPAGVTTSTTAPTTTTARPEG